MPTRNVVLTEQQSALVDRLVKSGRYQNASEVLRAGLRRIERDEVEAAARLHALREAACIGIADADAGRVRSFDSDADLDAHLVALTEDALRADSPDALHDR